MKQIIVYLSFFLLLTLTSYAEKIPYYEVNVTVEQSGELFIVESIYYDYEGSSKHGIYRDIPFTIKIKNRIKDLGLYDFDVRMNDASVAWKKETLHSSKAGEMVRLKIGSANSYVSGKKIYIISYHVKIGVLPSSSNKTYDAIRWNIIGTGWGIRIEHVNAHIFLPSSLNQNNVSISTYTGLYGGKTSQAMTQWINPEHLMLSVKKLNPHEGVTLELSYPSGLLSQNGLKNIEPSMTDWFLSYWHWGILAGFLLYFITMFKRYSGFENTRSIAVQYDAPKGLSLLQSGLILDKYTDNEDFSAAILELGQLGYLTIEHKDRRYNPLLKSTNKDTKSLSLDQRYLLENILFEESNTFEMSERSESKADMLFDGFNYINDNLYTWCVSDGYMVGNPQRIRRSFIWKSMLGLLPIVVLMFYTLYTKFGADGIVMVIFPLVFGSIGLGLFFLQKPWSAKIFGLIFFGFGLMPLLGLFDRVEHIESLFLGPLGVVIVILFLLYILYKKIGTFTQKGAYIKTHLLGLKAYISRVKENEIKRRLETDPLYLDKLLPYAMLFKENKHWLSFYDSLKVETPSWYMGNIHNMDDFRSSVDTTATPPQSSSSSSGGGYSGGGGFSGGGGGGGGGGSW